MRVCLDSSTLFSIDMCTRVFMYIYRYMRTHIHIHTYMHMRQHTLTHAYVHAGGSRGQILSEGREGPQLKTMRATQNISIRWAPFLKQAEFEMHVVMYSYIFN